MLIHISNTGGKVYYYSMEIVKSLSGGLPTVSEWKQAVRYGKHGEYKKDAQML